MKDKISSFIDWLVISFYSFIMIVIIAMALLRYLFGTSIPGGSELSRFLFIFTSCLGNAVLIERNEHVEFNLILNMIPNTIKKVILIIDKLLIVVMHCFLIYLCINWINTTGMFLSDIFRIQMKYVQIALPIGFMLAVFYGLYQLFDIFTNKE